LNEIETIIKKIQFKTDESLEQIALNIGFSRPHLNKAKISGIGKKVLVALKDKYSYILQNVPVENNIIEETIEPYHVQRQKLKNKTKNETLMYYNVGAAAGSQHAAEILPVKKSDGVLHINDLFKGSEYAIRISGNSMTPNYPSGAIIGIREVTDKIITPGSVYVIEKESDLWIKRLFYKNDNQELGIFECVSDNQMKYENGSTRSGRLYYPTFDIAIDAVRKLFKVTGIYKPNELTVIN
jgi:phage repressor protein C with HTH and peptisase S24 domain